MTSSFLKDHSLAIASMTRTVRPAQEPCTVRTYQDNGPYFPATKGCYQARSLKDLLFHTRLAMEDREDVIGLFDADGACKGIWQLAVEGHVDSAGDSIVDHEAYELLRPSTKSQWAWQYLQEQLVGKA
jgi:hypothetical protein